MKAGAFACVPLPPILGLYKNASPEQESALSKLSESSDVFRLHSQLKCETGRISFSALTKPSEARRYSRYAERNEAKSGVEKMVRQFSQLIKNEYQAVKNKMALSRPASIS